MQIRKYSPFLESALLDGNGALAAGEWQAVPDIWRTSAEKYGDHVALIDPYHDPPSSMTYKQVNFLSFFQLSTYLWHLFYHTIFICLQSLHPISYMFKNFWNQEKFLELESIIFLCLMVAQPVNFPTIKNNAQGTVSAFIKNYGFILIPNVALFFIY